MDCLALIYVHVGLTVPCYDVSRQTDRQTERWIERSTTVTEK